MTKLKVWCCHPVRHNGAKKIGRAPSHPKGKYLVSSKLDSFLKEQYNVLAINSSELTMPNLYVCTGCYEYEMDRFERIQASVSDQQLPEYDDQSAIYDRHADKDIINCVFRTLEIEEIVDM